MNLVNKLGPTHPLFDLPTIEQVIYSSVIKPQSIRSFSLSPSVEVCGVVTEVFVKTSGPFKFPSFPPHFYVEGLSMAGGDMIEENVYKYYDFSGSMCEGRRTVFFYYPFSTGTRFSTKVINVRKK